MATNGIREHSRLPGVRLGVRSSPSLDSFLSNNSLKNNGLNLAIFASFGSLLAMYWLLASIA